jgi:hypothetical protein
MQEKTKHDKHYERGFVDGMQRQMQSSVDRAINRMTKEDIIKLAQEAISLKMEDHVWTMSTTHLERFAALVAAAEREACVKACEEVESRAEELWDKFAYPEDQGMASGARQCTTAIRARGEK